MFCRGDGERSLSLTLRRSPFAPKGSIKLDEQNKRDRTTYFIAIWSRNSKLPEVGSRGAQTAIVPDIINI